MFVLNTLKQENSYMRGKI